MISLNTTKAQRQAYSIFDRLEAARDWNRESGKPWSIFVDSNLYQAKFKGELQGPKFETKEGVYRYMIDKIEDQIELHWFAKSRFDFDLC